MVSIIILLRLRSFFNCHMCDSFSPVKVHSTRNSLNSYFAARHLAEMIALLGSVPNGYDPAREKHAKQETEPGVVNPAVRLDSNATEYFAGSQRHGRRLELRDDLRFKEL